MTLHPANHRKLWLEDLIKTHNLKCGAELRVQEGVTYKHLIENCRSLEWLVGVDNWINPEYQEEYDGFYKDILEWEKSKNQPKKIRIWKMDTTVASEMIDNCSLDFVFIDADHKKPGVTRDIIKWTPKVKVCGWITGHDWPKPHIQQLVRGLLGHFGPIGQGPDMVWYVKKT